VTKQSAREPAGSDVVMQTFDVGNAEHRVAVVATGEIDVSNIDRLRTALHQASWEGDVVIADLSQASYIDSSTVELMVVTSRELRSKRGELLIVAPPECRARRVFAISGVEHELALFHTRIEAAESTLVDSCAEVHPPSRRR